MSILCMVYGQSGTGKSTSLRNFNPDEVAVINVSGKPMPFRTKLQTYNTDDYNKILNALSKTERKSIVIDDATYLMVGEFMRNAKVAGYQKYTDMAVSFNNLIEFASKLPDDVIVYFLHHTEIDSNTGKTKAKTVGKMLDNYLTLEGCFNIVLQAVAEGKDHYFITQSDGINTSKSPEDMFDVKIANDLAYVDKTIREYYGFEIKESEDK